ncbi:F0F1 ATP synthase subunit B [Hathewaya limosa]|uniref:ATP synthase subunit b n=1 Tax=Hathewaya limosa TaxID=1536 RepID=A0ABU0JMV4_HATLI|nr:F0F1 ATP synthase subunit B [Hathewaya limosa]AWZ49306.1 ATP synthase F0 subunit B [Clostridiaceae bacterium 14S0207]MDQ0478400.1 F-type H+-transporting ATPase subunit b [Hathewaya limosa]
MIKIEWTKILFAMVNFLIIYFFGNKYFFPKVREIIEKRNEEIQGNFDAAEKSKKDAAQIKTELEANRANVIEESKNLLEQYKTNAEKLYEEIVSDAKKEADIVNERSKKEIEREKQKAEEEIKTKVTGLSLLICEKVLDAEIDEKKHRELISDFISKVGI